MQLKAGFKWAPNAFYRGPAQRLPQMLSSSAQGPNLKSFILTIIKSGKSALSLRLKNSLSRMPSLTWSRSEITILKSRQLIIWRPSSTMLSLKPSSSVKAHLFRSWLSNSNLFLISSRKLSRLPRILRWDCKSSANRLEEVGLKKKLKKTSVSRDKEEYSYRNRNELALILIYSKMIFILCLDQTQWKPCENVQIDSLLRIKSVATKNLTLIITNKCSLRLGGDCPSIQGSKCLLVLAWGKKHL